jgi:hypothetical protein
MSFLVCQIVTIAFTSPTAGRRGYAALREQHPAWSAGPGSGVPHASQRRLGPAGGTPRTRLRARHRRRRSLLGADVGLATSCRSVMQAQGTAGQRDGKEGSAPRRDQSFDRVLCQFGVMFLPDKNRASREARRELNHGGHYLLATLDGARAEPCAARGGRGGGGTLPGRSRAVRPWDDKDAPMSAHVIAATA